MSRRLARQTAGFGRRSAGAALLAACAILLGVGAAWPIYETPQLWPVAGIAAVSAYAVVWAGARWRWGALTLVGLAVVLLVFVVPAAVPQTFDGIAESGVAVVLRGYGDGIAAIALGWKQLFTLTLPVGTYQTVLVPFAVLVFTVVATATALALRGSRAAVVASLPLLAPVVFGTVFGSSAVSDPRVLGPVTLTAPRELALWAAAFGATAVWMGWTAGRDRRAALRRGRAARAATSTDPTGRGAVRRNALARGGAALLVVAVAATTGMIVAPTLAGNARVVPRDSIDPEVVVREQVSPLADYRQWKRDDALDSDLFTVQSTGTLPARLRLAVLDGYDGVDFFVGEPAGAGRFTRFPSGPNVTAPTDLSVTIGSGYSGVWVPIAAPLAAPPAFAGPRAAALADSFYVNRETGAAVAVPTASGLRAADAFTATVSAATDPVLDAEPASERSLLEADVLPQLERWLELQGVAPSASGLATAIDRLRARGYLSHSLTDGEGERAWLTELGEDAPARFVSSPGGHSIARIEQLFTQLIEQQDAAGDRAGDDELVAAIGDDEQFAAAAALVARALGFDSRVVVGVRLGDEAAGVPGIPACSTRCEGQHVSAWIEARGADGVWAPIDVSPQIAVPPLLVEKGEQLPEFPTTPEERDASESDPPVGSSNEDGSDREEPEPERESRLWPVLRVVGLGAAALALLALAALFIPLVKRARRAARNRQELPELRALGAWQELLDGYADSGANVPAAGSRTDVALALQPAGLSTERGVWIAATVDQAVYAREGVSSETVDHLWKVVRVQLSERDEQVGFLGRLRSRYWLGSFARAIPRNIRSTTRARTRGARS